MWTTSPRGTNIWAVCYCTLVVKPLVGLWSPEAEKEVESGDKGFWQCEYEISKNCSAFTHVPQNATKCHHIPRSEYLRLYSLTLLKGASSSRALLLLLLSGNLCASCVVAFPSQINQACIKLRFLSPKPT